MSIESLIDIRNQLLKVLAGGEYTTTTKTLLTHAEALLADAINESGGHS